MFSENVQVYPTQVSGFAAGQELTPRELERAPRKVVFRTFGQTRGPITRLMSPSDLGEVLKPFVFLDLFEFEAKERPMPIERGWHPHSGIATVTVMLDGTMRFAETTGKSGELPAGAVEFMRAGNGVWHTGTHVPGRVLGFQLWIALPPELENGPNASSYVQPGDVPVVGPARVILGSYGGKQSPVDAPPMTYLSVRLKDGERWSYQPGAGHSVAWVAVSEGELQAAESVESGELAVFEPSEQAIDFVAKGDTHFVLGSAVPHPHELHLGNYSVHTSLEALLKGESEIRRIGQELVDAGTLR
jgi:redox-sensitive bicupin YhaK (pirin superfamily)